MKKKIAIYGLGTETRRILPILYSKYEIIGLLDGFRVDGEMYGKKIISLKSAIKEGIESIIVVARPGSCKAIVKKIGHVCKENGIDVFDVRGNNLLHQKRVVYDFRNLKGNTKFELLKQIERVKVVSFDLFDTLVMRNVLSFWNIQIVEEKLKERGIFIENFCDKRLAAEKNLSKGYAPTLIEIYEKILGESDNIFLPSEKLAEIEYETDILLLTVREDVVKLINKCKKLGKKVYITTDCYYKKNQIKRILEKFNITDIDDVLVSCEFRTAKTEDLFETLIELAGTTSILHVGDDMYADYESARQHGISAFKIYSGEELFDSVGELGLAPNIYELSDSIKVGMFVAKIFNSPFCFENSEKKITVSRAKDIGYIFCAPMINDFTYWFGEQIMKNGLKNIWFCARDGYLIKKIFDYIYPDLKSEYFLTSRISAIRAGMFSEDDIVYVENMRYSGNVEDCLLTRFGIDKDLVDSNEVNLKKEGLLRYTGVILKNSSKKRTYYKKYIQRLDINDGQIALFDFVSKGTTQMYLRKMIPNEIVGLYFLQLEPEFMKDKELSIISFYTDEEKDDSEIFKDYYILETILTSPEPSVVEFNLSGEAVYARETRLERDIECIMEIQEGIIDYVKRYKQICPKSALSDNKKLDEIFLMLMHNVVIDNENFKSLKIDDPFFNRVTDIADIL